MQKSKPTQNRGIESFESKTRDKWLNSEVRIDLDHTKDIIENRRHDYNYLRPHFSPKNLPPATWALKQLEILSLKAG